MTVDVTKAPLIAFQVSEKPEIEVKTMQTILTGIILETRQLEHCEIQLKYSYPIKRPTNEDGSRLASFRLDEPTAQFYAHVAQVKGEWAQLKNKPYDARADYDKMIRDLNKAPE